MSLNLKYRPKSLEEFYGNISTVKLLESFLKSKERHHCLLFYGPAGCGKTTLARILSKELGCKDIQEIDMGNNRGIETARNIINTVYLKPLSGGIKIYILDEVHKATNEFQTALLKTLEEPPSFVYFFLCTTEPEKLVKTIRSRSMSFTVSSLSRNRLKELLQSVCEVEKIMCSDLVIETISKESGGIPRDALVYLEQIKNLENEKDQIKAVKSINKNKENLCRLLLEKNTNWNQIMMSLESMEEESESIRRMVLGYFSKVFVDNPSPRIALILECFKNNFYDSGKAGLLLALYEIHLYKA